MTTSGLPSGVIGIFFPNPIIYTNTGATTTLTLLVTPFATAGVTSFTIKSTDLI